MLPDRVSNPGPLTYESGALPIALRGPAHRAVTGRYYLYKPKHIGNYMTGSQKHCGVLTLFGVTLCIPF